MLIYREEVYEPDTPRKGIADIIIAKQRNGPTGEVHLTFLGKYTRFENLAHRRLRLRQLTGDGGPQTCRPHPRSHRYRRAAAQPARRCASSRPAARVMAVIKANAYGHGLVTAAAALADADGFAVARLDEGARAARGREPSIASCCSKACSRAEQLGSRRATASS